MKKEIARNRVEGFLHAEGTSIVNGCGEPILLVGWGLGNWMLCEGYMWNLGGCPQFDRPRRIEQTIEALTGKTYAKRFWKTFRDSYITEGDLQMMAEMGYNSLRVPIAARLFLEDGPKLRFREEGFRLLDWLLDACEKYRLYVFIDLHAAPGGQTGDNIDDSLDDLCRLFIDDAQFDRGLALWEEIARRYHDRWIVGGYDLLNEPIRPPRFAGDTDLDRYTPRLKAFYQQAIERIRLHDQRHMVALEGIHWATDTGIFDHVYDPNMVIHFHRYACPPDISSLEKYLEVSRRLQLPLWLGETGENELAWLSALIPLAFRLGISVTLWPWKKMACANSPCSVRVPEGWQLIRDYLSGGSQPAFDAAQDIFNQYLHNIRIENCEMNEQINAQLYRIPGSEISGTDFDELPGREQSYHHEGDAYPAGCYRQNTGMEIVGEFRDSDKQFPFDGPWRTAMLRLHQGEWAQYTVYDVTSSTNLEIACHAEEPSQLEVRQNGAALGVFDLSGVRYEQVLSDLPLANAAVCEIRLTVLRGAVKIDKLWVLPMT